LPKFGDADEVPLSQAQVELLRKRFKVEVAYPELLFFRIPAFRRFTYRQFLYLS
jgi:hypothetical protein